MYIKDLPKHILDKAFISKSNELAWKKEDVSEALDSISDLGYDIAGGDIWIINNNKIMEIPDFSSSSQKENESWQDYSIRIKNEFLGWIEIMVKSQNESMKNKGNIYYLITF